MSDPLFSASKETPAEEAPTENLYSSLVGEGKKYKDNEAFAKSRLEADRFIAQLQSELQAARGEISNKLTMEEFLAKIESSKQNKEPVTKEETTSPNNEGLKKVEAPHQDINKIVQDALNQERQRSAEQANLEQAINGLRKTFGDNYAPALEQKAKELGVSKEYLSDMAKKSPQILLKLVGEPTQAKGPSDVWSPPSPNNPLRNPPQSIKTDDWDKYEELKRTNPRLYWSPKVQGEIHRKALASGGTFIKPKS